MAALVKGFYNDCQGFCYFDVSSLWPLAPFFFFFVKDKMRHNYLFCNMFLAETAATRSPPVAVKTGPAQLLRSGALSILSPPEACKGRKLLFPPPFGRFLQLPLAVKERGGRKPLSATNPPTPSLLFMRLNQ